MKDIEENIGVIFDKNDYAGFIKRVVITIVDLAVIFIVLASMFYISDHLIDDYDLFYYFNLLFFVSFLVWYLALLKRSRYRTPGYILAGVKIVDLKGRKPSVFKMVFRAFLLLIGPFEVLIDIMWLTQEVTKQTLRDKYVGTYVVRKDAVPAGKGRLQVVTLGVMGWSLMYREVKEALIK
ncbi:MAG: RDD family protein [Desulfobacterales bacterium]|nr:RDD family protein [Desulfobacterales bacterium]